jgi:hypothetical protein
MRDANQRASNIWRRQGKAHLNLLPRLAGRVVKGCWQMIHPNRTILWTAGDTPRPRRSNLAK